MCDAVVERISLTSCGTGLYATIIRSTQSAGGGTNPAGRFGGADARRGEGSTGLHASHLCVLGTGGTGGASYPVGQSPKTNRTLDRGSAGSKTTLTADTSNFPGGGSRGNKRGEGMNRRHF